MSVAAKPNQRDHILDTSLRLMSEHGAGQMSMRQLANECDLNVAAIYYYFDSKDALLAAVVDERRYETRLEEVPDLDPGSPAADRLGVAYRTVWEGALAEQAIWRLLLGEGLRGTEAVIPVGAGLLDIVDEGLVAWLRVGIPEITNPDATARLIVSEVFSGFIRMIFHPKMPTEQIAADSVAALAALALAEPRR